MGQMAHEYLLYRYYIFITQLTLISTGIHMLWIVYDLLDFKCCIRLS